MGLQEDMAISDWYFQNQELRNQGHAKILNTDNSIQQIAKQIAVQIHTTHSHLVVLHVKRNFLRWQERTPYLIAETLASDLLLFNVLHKSFLKEDKATHSSSLQEFMYSFVTISL